MLLRRPVVTFAGAALGEVGVSDLGIGCDFAVDVMEGISATDVSVEAKDNATAQISFVAWRQFADDAALEEFVLAHAGAVARSGTLAFTIGSKVYSAPAALSGVRIGEPDGLRLPVAYSFVGSPLRLET